ncbi:dTDP-4-dehydrorhamnose 3,5-epimerase [Massilia niabensis]|uniref:dTDP-4-dehydrorhamnose 3,5-epimerase n=1 Tax=Massilia niabensis TaxID=544910 RepID=A0ABW0L8G0_9BURK
MPLNVIPTAIADVLVLVPQVFEDDRGSFVESFNARAFAAATGVETTFVQDNHSLSGRRVLRGMHYQISHPQGKLIRVIEGSVFDVAVDLRRSSPTFGRWVGEVLSAENRRQMWIPPGFAHGFVVLGERAQCLYKTTDYWYPEFERTVLWNDPDIGIAWPIAFAPQLADKDAKALPLSAVETFAWLLPSPKSN